MRWSVARRSRYTRTLEVVDMNGRAKPSQQVMSLCHYLFNEALLRYAELRQAPDGLARAARQLELPPRIVHTLAFRRSASSFPLAACISSSSARLSGPSPTDGDGL